MPPLPGVLPVVAPSQSPPQLAVVTNTETAVTSTTAQINNTKTMTVQSETNSVTSCSTAASTGASSATADVASCSSSVTVQNSTVMAEANKNHSSDSRSTIDSSISNASSSSEAAESDQMKKEDETQSSDAEKSASTDLDTKDSSICLDNPRRILLKSVNPHIICNLCKGYLIDATTIVECLHSFCHSCIMKHLRTEQYCPRCEMMINTAKPNIKLDTTLQAIVYKLVPGLYEKELMRKRAFYRDRPEEAKLATPEQRGEDTEHLIFGPNENMSLSLEYADLEDIPEHDKTGLRTPKYLQCPASFTVAHLKKFVLLKFGINSRYFFVEIMYKVKTIVLSDYDTLMDVAYIYTWKRDAPMRFFFRVKENENALKLRRKMIEDNLRKRGEKRDTSTVKTEQDEMIKNKETENSIGNESASTDKGNIPEKTEPVKDVPPDKDTVAHLDISTVKEDDADTKKTKCKLPVNAVHSEEYNKSEKETLLSNSDDLSKSVNDKEKNTITPKNKKDGDKERDNKIPKHANSSSDQSTEKIKLTLVSKSCKQPKSSPGSSPRDEDRFTKSSSKERSPKHENIKLKIDLSNRKSFTIINMPGITNDREELVNPDKPDKHEKEWKLKSKKDKEDKSKSPKSSPGSDNKHQRFEIKNSSPPDFKSTVPPITIKAERKSPSSKNSEAFSPSFSIKQEVKEPEVDSEKEREKNEEEKKSEFLNSIALTPIKHSTSPDKTKVSLPKIPNTPVFGTSPVLLAPLVAKPLLSSKRKNKETSTKSAKKAKIENLKMSSPDEEEKTKDGNRSTATPSMPFKLTSFSVREDLAKKQIEDNKLMPAPPPLKVIDLKFKKNGMKPPKPPKGAKATASNKQKPVNFTSRVTAPPGSLTPHPSFPSGVATTKASVQTSAPGCRTPIARRYPPILPKSPRPNPFANIPNDVNKMLQNTGTEIKQISNGTGKDVKVYGPSMAATSTNPNIDIIPPSLNNMSTSATSRSSSKGQNNSSYLNYALFNASRAKISDVPLGCRTPIYTPSSPIYSPSSPQYMPNYNIPAKPTYKYTKSTSSSSNFLNNVLEQNKQLSSLFPAPPVKKPPESSITSAVSSNSSNNKTSPLPLVKDSKKSEDSPLKRSYPFSKSPPTNNASVKTEEPPEKQTKVQSLLNSCNISIPSSLSITITNEDGDSNVNSSTNLKLNNPVNNYIEILKLPDSQPVSPEKGDIKKSPSPPRSQTQSSRPIDMKETITPTSLGNTVTRDSVPRSSPSQATVQGTNTSPSLISSNNSPTKQIPSLNPIDKKQAQFENSGNPPITGKIKKNQSPEKKSSERNNQKKSLSDKKASAETASPQKGAKQAADATATQPSKKFRHILPRTTNTPKTKETSTTESAKLNLLANAFLSNLPSNSRNSKKTNNNNNNKKSEQPIDFLPQKQKTCNSPKTSPTPSAANQPSPDITAFISETLLRAQQQAASNSNGVYLPHLAAAANFNPHFASVNFGYNLQQAYLMEHISRMQKAGHEALEKYMQKLKGVNSIPSTSPNSPSNSSKDK